MKILLDIVLDICYFIYQYLQYWLEILDTVERWVLWLKVDLESNKAVYDYYQFWSRINYLYDYLPFKKEYEIVYKTKK